MRTTITLQDDVAAAVARMQREQGIGVSEAVNRLARMGLMARPERPRFVQRTADLGRQKLDITNIGDLLEVLEGPAHR